MGYFVIYHYYSKHCSHGWYRYYYYHEVCSTIGSFSLLLIAKNVNMNLTQIIVVSTIQIIVVDTTVLVFLRSLLLQCQWDVNVTVADNVAVTVIATDTVSATVPLLLQLL